MINKKRKGFTLVELLAVILILSLIFLISFGIFKLSIDDVNNTIDSVEENIILTAANNYALEYRGAKEENGGKGWHEEVEIIGNKEMTSFCVSLDSLMQYGYYKNDDSNFDKHRNNKAVYFEIENGVTTSKLIDLTESSKCDYFINSASLGSVVSAESVIKANDSNIDIGKFKYVVDELNRNTFKLNMDFNLNINEIFNAVRPINVVMILDASGSMFTKTNGDREYGCNNLNTPYEKAKAAIENFSVKMNADDSKIKGSKIALIEYAGEKIKLKNDNPFGDNVGDFACANLGETNVSGGIDMSTSLIHTSDVTNSDDVEVSKRFKENTYVILLYDGVAVSYSYMKCGENSEYKNREFRVVSQTFNNDEFDYYYDRFIYYDYYENGTSELPDDCSLKYVDQENASNENAVKYAEGSAKNLRSLDVKFINLGYNFNYNDNDYGTRMKKMATQNNDFCVDVSVDDKNFTSYKTNKNTSNEKKYCYYSGKSDNIDVLLNGLLNNIIKYNNTLESVKLVIKPQLFKNKDEQLETKIIFYDVDGNVVSNNNEDYNEYNNNVIEINFDDFNSNEPIKFLNDYVFKINDSFYEKKCGDNMTCSIEEQTLFDVSLEYKYKSNSEPIVDDLKSALFNLEMEKDKKLN